MAKLVKFNRGSGPEYGLLVPSEADENGKREIIPLEKPVTEIVKSGHTDDQSPGGGEFTVVDG